MSAPPPILTGVTDANAPEDAVAQLAQRLYAGYLSHHAAIAIAMDPRALDLVPPPPPGRAVGVGQIPRRSSHAKISYAFGVYLEMGRAPGAGEASHASGWP